MSKPLSFPLPVGTKIVARVALYGCYETFGPRGPVVRDYIAVEQGTVGVVEEDGMIHFPTRYGCLKNEPIPVEPMDFEGPATTFEVV